MIKLYEGDCLIEMDRIEDKSINLILADLPYGTTKNKWDVVIDPVRLWSQYNRIIKDNGMIVLFGSGLFTARMILSNEHDYKYSLVYEKTSASGHLNANRQPLRCHEDIMVFVKGKGYYNPCKTDGHKRKTSLASHKISSKMSDNFGTYNLVDYDSTERHTRSVLTFKKDTQTSALHSTQKPVLLIEHLIKMYSKEGDLVLDNTAGSGTTGVACNNLGRDCILIEDDIKNIGIIKERLCLDKN